MMGTEDSIYEGKTLEDAVKKGLEALRLPRAEVMITMVEEGASGFLGIGARPYKVRVMPRPGGPIKEPGEHSGSERRGGRGRGGSGAGRAGRSASGSERGGRGGDRRRGGLGEGRDRRERGPRSEDRAPRATSEGSSAEGRPARERDGGDRKRGRRTGRGEGEGRPERGHPGPAPHGAEAMREAPTHEDLGRSEGRSGTAPGVAPALDDQAPMRPEELAAQGRKWTEDLILAMGFEATVNATAEEDRVDVTLLLPAGEELLTGRKGEVRLALQHLLNLMLNRGGRTRYHLQLEINDFWQRREVELQDLARSLAEEALAGASEAVSEYLNAQERRVVHVTLKEDPRVKTYALGTGLIKRVAVAPADFPADSREEE